jgi:hypothetical protein
MAFVLGREFDGCTKPCLKERQVLAAHLAIAQSLREKQDVIAVLQKELQHMWP